MASLEWLDVELPIIQAAQGDFAPLRAGENATGRRPIPAAELTRALAREL